jgi:hypothetical protein
VCLCVCVCACVCLLFISGCEAANVVTVFEAAGTYSVRGNVTALSLAYSSMEAGGDLAQTAAVDPTKVVSCEF